MQSVSQSCLFIDVLHNISFKDYCTQRCKAGNWQKYCLASGIYKQEKLNGKKNLMTGR